MPKTSQLSRAGQKRGPAPIDEPMLRSIALRYVARYMTTRARLAAFLKRKVRERGWHDGEPEAAIDRMVEDCVALGYLNDQDYAHTRAATLSRRGFGDARIRQTLAHAGIDRETIASIESPDTDQAVAAALRFARTKRVGPAAGPAASEAERRKAHDRGFRALVRAGHAPAVAAAVMRMDGFDVDNEATDTNTA